MLNKAPVIYKFPYDNPDDYRGTITFYRKIIHPPNIDLNSGSGGSIIDAIGSGDAKKIATAFEGIATTTSSRRESTEDAVKLYLPQAIAFNDGIQYDNNVQLGVMGAAAEASINNGGNLGQAITAAVQNGIGSLTDLFSRNASGDLARLITTRAATNIPGETASNVASNVLRTAINPNRRTLFRGVAAREFTFQFKMIANSPREAEEIQNIINFFRRAMYPTDIPLGDVSAGYNYPDMFSIQMSYNGNKVGYKVKNCFLANMTQTINPTSMGYHLDGKPSEVDMSITFFEETTISRKDVENGY